MTGTISKEALAPLDAEILHTIAYQYEWDEEEFAIDLEIDHPRCALATAIMMYWRASPYYFLQYATPGDVPDFNQATYALLEKIETGVLNQRFLCPDIDYDPRADRNGCNHLRRHPSYRSLPIRRLIPKHMYIAIINGSIVQLEPPEIISLREDEG
jgi:hypothetical protein